MDRIVNVVFRCYRFDCCIGPSESLVHQEVNLDVLTGAY